MNPTSSRRTLQYVKIKLQYEKKVIRFLNRLKAVFEERHLLHCNEVEDYTDEEYCWGFELCKWSLPCKNPDKMVCITLAICESEEWDGTSEGMSFRLNIVKSDGEELFVIAPHNYTDEVWVNIYDDAAVKERWKIFEDVIVEALCSQVNDKVQRFS